MPMLSSAHAPYFNTAGSCIPDKHYMLSPEPRFGHVMRLVDEEKYFTLHAGRQTGKSTALIWLANRYNQQQRYRALWIDIQPAREQPDLLLAFRTLLNNIEFSLQMYWPDAPRLDHEELLQDPGTAILRTFRQLAAESDRPLVVLVDEADGLVGPTMVSFLTQLRAGCIARHSAPFPHSMALVGMRQVRDCALSAEDRRTISWLGTMSPFNVTAEAATLEPFSRGDVHALLEQHTEHTGQRWDPNAKNLIYDLSQGHPWLVNAIADQIVNRDVEDRAVDVSTEHVEAAKETIIQQRRTHMDSLLARLREDRVRRVIEPMIVGGHVPGDALDDDFSYVLGLGLITTQQGQLHVANPIYREVISLPPSNASSRADALAGGPFNPAPRNTATTSPVRPLARSTSGRSPSSTGRPRARAARPGLARLQGLGFADRQSGLGFRPALRSNAQPCVDVASLG